MNTGLRVAASAPTPAICAMPGAGSVCDWQGASSAVDAVPEPGTEADALTRDTAPVPVEHRDYDLQQYAGTARARAQRDIGGVGIGNDRRKLQVAVPVPRISNQERSLGCFVGEVGSANNIEFGAPGLDAGSNNFFPSGPCGYRVRAKYTF